MNFQPITINNRVGTVLFIDESWQPVDREYATYAHVSFDDGGSAFYNVSVLKAAGGPGSGRYPKGSGIPHDELHVPAKSIAQVNQILTHLGYEERLVKGSGYLYFDGGDASSWFSSSVSVPRVSSLSPQRWIDERNELAIDKRNSDDVLARESARIKLRGLGGRGSGNFGHAGREGKVGGSGKVTDTKAFTDWFGDSKVVDENGDPLVVYHGTTHDITQFGEAGDPMYNPESDWGAAAYFTDSAEDMSANYAGIGPDLTQRIEIRAEQIQQNSEFNDPSYHMSIIEAQNLATEELTGHAHGGVAMPMYVKMDTPFVVGKREDHPVKETRLTHELEYDDPNDPDSDIIGYKGTLTKFTDAVRYESKSFHDTEGVDDLIEHVMDHAGSDDGIDASALDRIWRNHESISYVTNDEGQLVGRELFRRSLQRIGFDGVIDRTVNQKFGSEKRIGRPMEGMDPGTTHYIAFVPPNVKSAIGNTKFDPKNPLITMRAYTRETAVHKAADAHIPRMQSAIDYAFAAGRAAVDHALLKRATNRTDAERAVTGVPEAVAAALRDVLPGTLAPIVEAGGNAGLSLLRPRLKAAGGAGSGNFGHAGREGKVGGSATVDGPNEAWYKQGGEWNRSPEGDLPVGWRDIPAADYEVPEIRHKVLRDKSLYVAIWGQSHGGSQAVTGASSEQMGIPGYRVNASPEAIALSKRFVKEIADDKAGSEEVLHHEFENVRSTNFNVGDTLRLPLTATSGDIGGYGVRLDKDSQRGEPTLFVFEKGTQMVAYSGPTLYNAKELGHDNIHDMIKEFGHVWDEAIVAGGFQVTDVKSAYFGSQHAKGNVIEQLYGKVVKLKQVETFHPESGWSPRG